MLPSLPRSVAATLVASAVALPALAPTAGAATPLRVVASHVQVAPDGARYRSGGRVCQVVDVTVSVRFNQGVAFAAVATKGFGPTEGMRAVDGRTAFRLLSRYGRIVCVRRRGQTGEALRKTVRARGATGQTVTKVLPRIRWTVR